MSEQIIQALPELRPHSNKKIADSVICGINQCFSGDSYQLVKLAKNTKGPGLVTVLTHGSSSLAQKVRATRKRLQLPTGAENNITWSLNTALLGGESYPITTMIGGIVAGAVSVGAGFLFAAATTALSMSQKSKRILARRGDEIWQVEEIGKEKASNFLSGKNWNIVHVGSYWLVDPYRKNAWLLHESRNEITI